LELRFKTCGIGLTAAIFLAALCAFPLASRAAELVTYSNGYIQRCDHHALVDGLVRLYLSAGEDSYIDREPAKIASFETIPDPPSPVSPAATARPQTPTTLTPGDLREMLTRAGADHNLDVDLLASVVKAESDGNFRAVSRAGAQGLMQLMPGTAAGLGVKDSFQPDENVRGGSTYLDGLLTKYHDNLLKPSTDITAFRPITRRRRMWHTSSTNSIAACLPARQRLDAARRRLPIHNSHLQASRIICR
jgi:Transglycosylase SLT domain